MQQQFPVFALDRMEDLMPLIRETLSAGQSVRIFPMGTSMLPMLRQKVDSVVLSPIPGKLRKYDIPLYQRDNGKYVLHRIVQAGETYICMGDNQYKSESGIRDEQLIAVVTVFYRGERKHAVTDLSYWLYSRFWCHIRPLRKFYRRCIGWLKRKLHRCAN